MPALSSPPRESFHLGPGRLRAIAACLALLAVPRLAWSQEVPAELEGVSLSVPVRAKLLAVRSGWLEWDRAFAQGDELEARRRVETLRETALDLGMERLPDVGFAMLARAVESARDGQIPRARWAIAMVEDLDPGSPEAAFALASVARADDRFGESTLALARGYLRSLTRLMPRTWGLVNLVVWWVSALAVSAGIYACYQIVVHGPRLVEDLADLLQRRVPLPLAYGAAFLVMIWPIFLASGWRWLPFYWTILVWRWINRPARVVLAGALALVLVMPTLLGVLQDRLEIETSSPMRAIRELRDAALAGSLFRDVEALQAELPEHPAVRQLIADLHLQLRQVELARVFYESVLEVEPHNTAALNNLGCYYLQRRQYGKAIEVLENATTLDPDLPEPLYNLFRVYQENLAIEEAVRSLEAARQLDSELVAGWEAEALPFVPSRARGADRYAEIRSALRRVRDQRSEASGAGDPGTLSLLLSVVVGGALVIVLGRMGSVDLGTRPISGEGGLGRFLLFLLPGLRSLLDGRSLRSYAAVLVPASALALLRVEHLGYAVPWGIEPGASLALALAGATLFVFYSLRLLRGSS